jgi:hypothetical protein
VCTRAAHSHRSCGSCSWNRCCDGGTKTTAMTGVCPLHQWYSHWSAPHTPMT